MASSAGIFIGIGLALMRVVNKSGVHPIHVPLWEAIYSFVFAGIMHFGFGEIHPSNYTSSNWVIMLITGAASTGAFIIMSYAYKYEEASKLGPMMYLTVAFSFIVDITLFHLSFDFKEITGLILITVCILTPIIYRLYL